MNIIKMVNEICGFNYCVFKLLFCICFRTHSSIRYKFYSATISLTNIILFLVFKRPLYHFYGNSKTIRSSEALALDARKKLYL